LEEISYNKNSSKIYKKIRIYNIEIKIYLMTMKNLLHHTIILENKITLILNFGTNNINHYSINNKKIKKKIILINNIK